MATERKLRYVRRIYGGAIAWSVVNIYFLFTETSAFGKSVDLDLPFVFSNLFIVLSLISLGLLVNTLPEDYFE